MLVDQIDPLRTAFRTIKCAHPFCIDALVILPEHLQAIWTLPPDDDDDSGWWRTIKTMFTRSLAANGHRMERNPKGEYDLWQRRFWEHTLRDGEDLRRHIEYVHFKSVKHGHVMRVRDWPYSTFHRYVRLGVYPPDWAGEGMVVAGAELGESSPGFRYASSGLRMLLGISSNMDKFGEIVRDLKRRLDVVDSFPPGFIRHLLASLLHDSVKVRMQKEQNHARPHIHVYYKKEHSASIAIDTGEILVGEIPRKYLKVIQAWVFENEGYLLGQWASLQAGNAPIEHEAWLTV